MSGITRPVAARPSQRHAPPVFAQLALTLLAAALTAVVVLATSSVVARWG